MISRGSLATIDQLPEKLRADPLKFDAPQYFTAPDVFPNGLGNKLIFGAMTELWYRTGKTYRGKAQNLTQFYHPLDMIGEWNRAYGSVGFSAVPVRGAHRGGGAVQGHHVRHPALRALLLPQRVQAVRSGQPGTAELPDPRLERVRRLPDQARASTSSSTNSTAASSNSAAGCTPPRTPAPPPRCSTPCIPRIDEWIAVRRKVDPDGVFASDMARRLELL